jgi:F0F1-type ATP synthase delta subunit
MRSFSYDLLIEDLKTADDLELLAAEIDMLLVSLYQNDSNAFKDTLDTKLQRRMGDLFVHSLTEQKIALTDREQLQEYFTELKEFISHLPHLQLTLPYHPSNEQIGQLSDWVRQQTGKAVILQLKYNKRLLGGAVITYGGAYKDLSLKKKLETVFVAKREELMGLIK